MIKADIEFLLTMVTQLDNTIRKLRVDEQRISCKLSEDRIEELKEYWNQELSDEEAQSLKETFDYWDKSLIATWAHTRRAHISRAA
ncbi:MAG: hypothetical protein KAJ63_01975, partial [Methyloprofundus sp.]|nr:hypothetical protein [Methyloprofundus sp.]